MIHMEAKIIYLKKELRRHGLKYSWLFRRLRDEGFGDFSESTLKRVLSGCRAPGKNEKYINKGLEIVSDYEKKIERKSI